MKAGMQKSRKLPDFVVRPAEAHASIFSRKLLLAPSNAQNFLAARPPLGARGPTAQIWDPLSERTPPSAWRGRPDHAENLQKEKQAKVFQFFLLIKWPQCAQCMHTCYKNNSGAKNCC